MSIFKRSAIAALITLTVATPAAHARIEYRYSVDYQSPLGSPHEGTGAVVRTNSPFYSETTTPVIVHFVSNPGALRTEARMGGHADTRTREFGAQARVIAKFDRYDPETGLSPGLLITTSAEAVISFADRITPNVAEAAPGARVTIEFAPQSFSGTISGPGWVDALGEASVRATLTAMPVSGIGDVVERTFERALQAGTLLTHFNGYQSLFSNIELVNGQAYEWGIELRVVAGVLADPTPPEDPRESVTYSDFGNTLKWGGIAAVRDSSGALVTGFSMASANGFDWVTPVPEPGAAALLSAGLAVLGWRLRPRC